VALAGCELNVVPDHLYPEPPLMALVTFSGYPSSGKTRRAIQLKEHLNRRLADPSCNALRQVIVLSDDSLNIDRSSYNGTVPLPLRLPCQSITML
jgi:hypothetical protein